MAMMNTNKTMNGITVTSSVTKILFTREVSNKIAVLQHENLDEVAALGLIEAQVKAVINAADSMTADYPLKGPMLLLSAGIPVFEISPQMFGRFQDNLEVTIQSGMICYGEHEIPCTPFTMERWIFLNQIAQNRVESQLSRFIDNTLDYAKREKNFFIRPPQMPRIKTAVENRHALIVVRGNGYKQDLRALTDYISSEHPVMIGVDGGADALMEAGCKPNLIIGDMDSVSDEALKSGAELIVHAYPNGRAPGLERIHKLGLSAACFQAPGTSEDIAMLLAYELRAEWIVAVGSHSHMIEYLEKGRSGMASSLLVRMKIGSKLIDAKGISRLYQSLSAKDRMPSLTY